MLKCNYHTHLKLCHHAEGMSEDYVKEAIRLGMKEIGISDHAPVPETFMTKEEYISNYCDENMTYDTFINEYILDVLKAKEKYKNDIKVILGLETEYISDYHEYYQGLRDKVDYLILGMHFFKQGDRIKNIYLPMSKEDVLDYARSVEIALDSGLFKYLAHPDLFMYMYNDNVFDSYAVEASNIIIDAAIRNDCLLELNAGGVKYGMLNGSYRYPHKEFFEIAKAKKAKIILGADAHYIDQLSNYQIEEIIKIKEELNLDTVTYMD